jgi:hypothetical protein
MGRDFAPIDTRQPFGRRLAEITRLARTRSGEAQA